MALRSHDITANGTSPAGPSSRLGTAELFLAVFLAALLAILSAADCAGAFLAHSHLISLTATAHFIASLVHHDPSSSPTAAWSERAHHFAAFAFWSITGILLIPPTMLLAFAARRRGHRDIRGFATRTQLAQVATRKAAERHAKVTRPPHSVKGAPTEAFGYRLGTTVIPRGVPLVASFEHSLELVAPPGSGKTLRVLAPILRHHPGPVLATSTKPDLYETTAIARQRFGPVYALDPDQLCPAAMPLRWSPVAGCADSMVAERRAAALVAASGDGADVRGGGFFRRSAATVLASYLQAAALSGGSMRDVLSWSTRPNDPAPLRILTARGEDTIDWGARLHAHTSGAAETTSGVMRTVDLALSCFADPAVLANTTPRDGKEFSFDEFFANSGTVYALGKDRGNFGGSGPLVTAFADELLLAGELRAATLPGRRLDPPLLACLDEAPSIAPLPGLPGFVADGRGRGIVVLVAMQSFSQAEERWGHDGARTIRNAASILMVFGGLSVASDLEELARLCGNRLVERSSTTANEGGRASLSRHLAEEPVLTPSAIHALSDGTALVLFGRLPPLLTYLPGLWEQKDAKQALAEESTARAANDAARAHRTQQLEAVLTEPLRVRESAK